MRWIIAVILGSTLTQNAASAQRNAPPVTVHVPPPINTAPIEERYGDWTAARLGTGWAAYTGNESGSKFGIFCKDGCIAYLNAQTKCDDKEEYPALVNSSDGAFSVTFECVTIEKRYVLAMRVNQSLVNSFEIGGELGIAFPMQGGQFQVTRFSLTGALKAADRVASIADSGKTARPSNKRLRDYNL